MIIDSHQHFWDPDRGDYHWMSPSVPVLARHSGPGDLRPLLRKAGVVGTVLVQAAQTVAETAYLLGIARETDFVLGVVGWLDMEAPDFAAKLVGFRKDPLFLGLRPMLQDLEDDAWILRPGVLGALRVVADLGVPFEFLTFPRHLPYAIEACARTPGLVALVDHISKPSIATGDLDPWRDGMTRLAEVEGMRCKLSGMITEADHGKWCPSHLQPYVDHVLKVFGPGRVMFGSDWPVCHIAGQYGEVVNALRTCIGGRYGDDEIAAIFAKNAIAFYGLTEERLNRARGAWR
jgi:L-fuconolactonase